MDGTLDRFAHLLEATPTESVSSSVTAGTVGIDDELRCLDQEFRSRGSRELAAGLHVQQLFHQSGEPAIPMETVVPTPLSKGESFADELSSLGILGHPKNDHIKGESKNHCPNTTKTKTPDDVIVDQFVLALSRREQNLGAALTEMGASLERDLGALHQEISELAQALESERRAGLELRTELRCSQTEIARTERERDDARIILAQARVDMDNDIRETQQLNYETQKLREELSCMSSNLVEEREQAQSLRKQLNDANTELSEHQNLTQSLKNHLLRVNCDLHSEHVELKSLRERLSCVALCSDAQLIEQHDEARGFHEQLSRVEVQVKEEVHEAKILRKQLCCTEAELAGERAVGQFELSEGNGASSAFDARMKAMEAALVVKDPALAALVGTIGRSLMRELSSATQTVAEAEDMLAQRKLGLGASSGKGYGC